MKPYRLLYTALTIGWGGLALPAHATCIAPPVEPQALLTMVEAQVRQASSLDGLQVELEPIGTLPTIAQPSTRLLTHGLHSRMAVELASDACGHRQVATVWFKLRAYQVAWVYGANAKAGKPLAVAQPLSQKVDLAKAQIAPNDLAIETQDQWLTQDVRAGMPVLTRHLQPEPMVKRDEMVRVVVHSPGLIVSIQGKAMRAGMLGEDVPVLLEGAGSSLVAVVAGKGEVHVQ